MRSPGAVVVALALAALAGLAAAALLNERSQAFTLGVVRSTAAKVKPREEICQAPITVPASAAFEGVTFAVGTNHRTGPALDLSVRAAETGDPAARGGTMLARGTLPAGYPDVDRVAEHTVRVGPVSAGSTIAVCFTNRGRRPAFIYGNADAAARSSSAFLDGKPLGTDLALDFERREPRSLAALAPAMIERAALFRARAVGPWTYVVLALLVLLAAPALLVRALRAAARETT
jgi:hypothetical protein